MPGVPLHPVHLSIIKPGQHSKLSLQSSLVPSSLLLLHHEKPIKGIVSLIRLITMCARAGFIGRRLCPNLVFVPPTFAKYTAAAAATRAVFERFDPGYEAGSLDEAYLDVTDYSRAHGLSGAPYLLLTALQLRVPSSYILVTCNIPELASTTSIALAPTLPQCACVLQGTSSLCSEWRATVLLEDRSRHADLHIFQAGCLPGHHGVIHGAMLDHA